MITEERMRDAEVKLVKIHDAINALMTAVEQISHQVGVLNKLAALEKPRPVITDAEVIAEMEKTGEPFDITHQKLMQAVRE